MISVAEFELMVRRCLEHGVPTGVVAAIFDLEPALVSEMRKEVLITQYGTSDQAEYLENIQWKTLQRAAWLVEHGSAADATRVSTAVLGKQLALTGKKAPDSQREAVSRITQLMEDMRSGPADLSQPPSRFVVGAGVGAPEDEGEEEQ